MQNTPISTLLALCLAFSLPLSAQDQEPVALAVLGTYHFANPGQDDFNVHADDVLTPQRQQEIETLTDKLAEFKPTRIFIERRPEYQARYDSLYQAYRAGRHELTRSEEQQLGFRLAARLDHDRLYCVDAEGQWFSDQVFAYAKEHGQAAGFEAHMAKMGAFIQEANERLRRQTITENLRQANEPAMLAMTQDLYISVFTPIGAGDNYIGADLNAEWYRRNLRIFANIMRHVEPGDRVLVIFGSGHAPLLNQFARDSQLFEWTDITKYLH